MPNKKKIVIVQDGADTIFPLMSLLIGLNKAYPKCQIIWAGEDKFADLVKFNKRINRVIDVSIFNFKTLQIIFGADLCINLSPSISARQFASNAPAQQTLGFTRGACSKEADFLDKILKGETKTNKSILQLYYDVAGLKWNGEGYGLSYYPKTKQTKSCGQLLAETPDNSEGEIIHLQHDVLKQLDTINQFSRIITDDLYVAHASIALRKECIFYGNVPYRMEFFGKGSAGQVVQ